MLLALDKGDTTTPTEKALISHEDEGAEREETSARRLTRARKHIQDSNLIVFDFVVLSYIYSLGLKCAKNNSRRLNW